MVDVLGTIRTFLLADGPTAAASGGRIYGGALPKDELANQPRAAIVLRRSGGGALGRGNQFGDKRIDVDAYGATEQEASVVFDAAYTALKALRRQLIGGVLVHYANVSSDGTSGHDAQTGWPLCIGSFQVLVAEVPASN